MNKFRFLLSLCLVSALTTGFALAADQKKDEAKEEKACDCGKDKDGKTCGVDKDCCCTGKKATKADDKKAEKKGEKPDEKKPAKG